MHTTVPEMREGKGTERLLYRHAFLVDLSSEGRYYTTKFMPVYFELTALAERSREMDPLHTLGLEYDPGSRICFEH